MPPRRPRRRRRALLPPIDSIRLRARHGDRSLHDSLFTRVPILRIPALGAVVPGADFTRSGEPLHAYVRYVDDGGEWP